jgi:hypothetical protein
LEQLRDSRIDLNMKQLNPVNYRLKSVPSETALLAGADKGGRRSYSLLPKPSEIQLSRMPMN